MAVILSCLDRPPPEKRRHEMTPYNAAILRSILCCLDRPPPGKRRHEMAPYNAMILQL